jgi:hypothetical protein
MTSPTLPASSPDPVIEAYKRDVDRTLLIENLRLTPQERSEKFRRAMALVFELRRSAGRPKDFEAIAELEALLEERNKN